MKIHSLAVVRLTFLAALLLNSAFGQVNVLTNRYNQARTSANTNETQLTQANVNTSTFGKLGRYSVDGVIYAQPLYVQSVAVSGSVHNVLYVATMHDVLYAFDADNVGSIPLWTLDFRNLAAGISAAPIHIGVGDQTDPSVADTFGIFGTPVIDLPNNRIFFVTHTLENGTECFLLRDVDIRTGTLLNSTLITGSVAATAFAGSATFIPAKYGQRPALELADGQVWVAFGSRPTGDYTNPWQGWMMTYNPNTLVPTGVFATSRTNGNSIWQSGAGPAVDANGNVYYLTGNGSEYDGATEFPMTLLQMNYSSSLNLINWYTPDSGTGTEYWVTLDTWDLDLSCNGPMLIPGTDLVTFGSKTADVYLLHTGNLGQLTPNDTQLAQFFHVGAPTDYTQTDSDRIVGMAYWQGPAGGTLYVWPGLDTLHAYTLNTSTSTFSQSFAGTAPLYGQPATALAISANGSTSGTGILWAPVMNAAFEENTVGFPGVLHAFNAENPAQELWNSSLVSSDSMGTLPKFVPPVVANGKVYMANSALLGNYGFGSVTVYGLKTDLSNHVNPYITLTSPTDATTFVAGSNITLTASAYPGGSPISSVSFMDGPTVLATLNQAPYSYTYTAAAIGSHTLTARVIDTTGAVTTAVPATINVVGTPTYTLSSSPSSIVLPPGGSTTATITFNPLNGYTSGSNSIYASGLPSGVSDSWAQSADGNSFTLTLSAAANAPTGTSVMVLVSGSGGEPGSLFLPVTISPSALLAGANTVTFNVPSGTAALGTPIVFTEGVPSSSLANPDFALVSSGTTCSGALTGACVVNVQFNPQYAGLRRGAVKLVDVNNNVVATSYIFGVGAGSLAPLTANQNTLYNSGSPRGITVDAAGNVFVLASAAGQVFKVAPGGSPVPVPLGVTLNSPYGLALDAAGNLYIADAGNNRVLELLYGGTVATPLSVSGLNFPEGVAVDGAGNIYIANTHGAATSGKGSVIKLSAGVQTTLLNSGLSSPSGVALDAAGDVFVADSGNNRVLEIPLSSKPQVSIGSNLANASAVAVDALGDVFIADENHNQVVEIPGASNGPGTGTQVTIATGLSLPYGLAIDGQGDVFVANVGTGSSAGSAVEIPTQLSQTINFPAIPTQTAGIPLTLVASATSGLAVAFTSSTPGVCAVSGSVAAFVGTGVCTIVASQSGNAAYAAATSVSQSFNVVAQAQAITFASIATQTQGVSLALTGSATSGLPLVYTSSTPAVCSVTGTQATLAASGLCTIVASQPGSAIYAPATPVAQSFNVVGSGQTIAAPFTFTVPNGVTLGTPVVFTEGVPSSSLSNPDFTLAPSGNTCTGQVNGACSVNVRFTPQQAGLRRGAVKLVDTNNNVLATSYISGIGSNPQTPWTAGVSKTIVNGGYPRGVTVDGAGNIFIVDSGSNLITKITSAGVSSTLGIGATLNSPFGLALDAAGNLYIADSGNNRVLELPYGSNTASALNITGLNFPEGIAVDGAGNLFIANTRAVTSTGAGNVIELAAGAGGQSTVIASGLSYPSSVAVDAAGDVFVADWGNDRVLEQSIGGATVSIGAGIGNASAVAVDASGDVFITDQTHNQLVEVPGTANGPGTGNQVTVASGLVTPYALALDGQGDIFVVNVGSGAIQGSVLELPRAIQLTFTVPAGVTLGTPVVFTEGVPSSTLPNPDFTLVAAQNTCTGAVTGTCTLAVQFMPQRAGLRRGAVKLVDNKNNVLATSFISGFGPNILPAWTPGATKSVYAPTKSFPRGVTVDGAGNVFVVDTYNNQIYKIAPGGAPLPVALGVTLNSPYGLALDAAGDLFIADAGNNRVLELPFGGTTAAALNLTGLNSPEALAVDGAGNLFIANSRVALASGTGNILKLTPTGAQNTILGSGLNIPTGVALDAAGDIFIADKNNNRVLEIPVNGTPVSLGSNLSVATAVAVDGAGDVFIADENHSQLVELPATAAGPGTGTQTTVATGLLVPYALALDGQGDVFVANVGAGSTSGSVLEVLRAGAAVAQAQTISFNAIAAQALGASPALTATASSALPVSFASNTPAVCTISGSTATLRATGICTVVASQSGSSTYLAATPVEQSFTVLGPGQTLSATFTIPNGVTLGTPIVFTEGVPSSGLTNPDFTLSTSGTTCLAGAAGACTVNVQFTPQFAGLRRGAVKLVDNNKNVLSTSYISGIGANTLPAWNAGAAKTVYGPVKGFPRGVAVDGAGNVFVVETYSNQVLKIAPGGAPVVVNLGTALNSPYGLALDAAGNLYIADAANNRVLELPYGGSTAVALNIAGLTYPEAVAVDGAGNLFIANTRAAVSSGNGNVLKVAAGTAVLTTIANSGLGYPSGVALDASGDVFIADKYNNRVLEIPASGAPIAIGGNLNGASAVAVDAAGDVFIADQGNNRLVEVTASGTQTTIATGLLTPYALALDGIGDVFIANVGSGSTSGNILEVTRAGVVVAQPQTIAFSVIASQTVGAPLSLTATASSGLTVSYASNTPAICTVSGGTASLLTSGTCSIVASQAGSSAWLAASPVTESFAVVGSAQTTVTFTVPSAVTLGAPIVFTEGVPSASLANPDFTLASTTCTGAATGTCTVTVQVTPQFPGLRRGAVKLVDNNHNLLATAYVSGIGATSPTPWTPGTPARLYFHGAPRGIAVDGAGDVFFVDSSSNTAYEITPGGTPTPLTLGTTLNSPFGMAIDGAGNLYIADAGNNRVLELPYGGTTATAVAATGLAGPHAVAIDGAGNLFIANTLAAAVSGAGNVVELAVSGLQTTVWSSGLAYPSGIAVDGSGNIFIGDWGNYRVLEVSPNGATASIGSNLSYSTGVAVDAAGDVFIADQVHGQIVEVPGTANGPGTGTQVAVATGLPAPYGLALDGAGDIFVASVGNISSIGSVVKVP